MKVFFAHPMSGWPRIMLILISARPLSPAAPNPLLPARKARRHSGQGL